MEEKKLQLSLKMEPENESELALDEPVVFANEPENGVEELGNVVGVSRNVVGMLES